MTALTFTRKEKQQIEQLLEVDDFEGARQLALQVTKKKQGAKQ